MGTLHVVVVDLQLGLGMDGSILGEQEVLVGLISIRLPGIRMNVDLAVKYPPCLSGQNPLVELAAGTMGLDMVHTSMVIYVLPAPHHIQTIQSALASLTTQHRVEIISNQGAPQRY